jgi:hypothetical protein
MERKVAGVQCAAGVEEGTEEEGGGVVVAQADGEMQESVVDRNRHGWVFAGAGLAGGGEGEEMLGDTGAD